MKISYPKCDILKNILQIVFEGDPLRLQCQASLAGLDSPTISWFWGKQDPSVAFKDVRLESTNLSITGALQR